MQPSFTEIQKFNKWWHYAIAGFPLVLMCILFFLTEFDFVKTKNNQKEPVVFMVLIGITFAAFIWFASLRLRTTINDKGIFVTFFGMPFCKRAITWENIKSISVIEYSPITDYGGWGVRYSLTGNGWCYNVAGKTGIKISYKNEKHFLIGTQHKEEAEAIITHYSKH